MATRKLARTLTVSRKDFTRHILPDSDPDASYLEQEGFEERLAAWKDSQFWHVGLCARCRVSLPVGGRIVLQDMKSPGLWGIESDSGEEHFQQVFKEECQTLEEMLTALGVEVTD